MEILLLHIAAVTFSLLLPEDMYCVTHVLYSQLLSSIMLVIRMVVVCGDYTVHCFCFVVMSSQVTTDKIF